ncbi:hypothetical protein GCM10009547_01590 [Sporichthya brevicatena]|jgi:ferredoxin|uniref:Ferredoxin n=1 Tax=Sporichthya brevicatena TaxID=171442 RepID=A0ABN1G3Y2_9ACTN
MSPRVTVDLSKCAGHALCLAAAPDAFDYDETEGKAIVLPEAADADEESLEQAARGCPERAITVAGSP